MNYPGAPSNGPPFHSDYPRSNGGGWDRPHRGRGGHSQDRYGGMRDHSSDRSRPYEGGNRGNQDKFRNHGPRNHQRRPNGPAPIHRYIKPSFFENPWHSLEEAAGIPSQTISTQETAPPVPQSLNPPDSHMQLDEKPLIGTSATKLGLSLPPPKQKTSSSGSAISSFLSKLPPPKSSSSPQDIDI